MDTLALPAFNPLKFANTLKAAGVPEQQAEAEAEALHEVLAGQAQAVVTLESKLAALEESAKRDAEVTATKGDIALVHKEIALIHKDIALVHKELDAKIEMVRKDLEAQIVLARRDTIIWLGGMLIAGFGTVIGMLKFG